MTRRSIVWFVLGAAAASTPVLVMSCSSTPQLAGLAQGCSINTDCNSPLICAFTRCHEQCQGSRDCAAGETCVSVGVDRVCELPSEATCSATTSCPQGLVCSSAQTCRNSCMMTSDCTIGGQTCVAGACQEPAATTDGSVVDAPVDAFVAADSSSDVGVDAAHDAPTSSDGPGADAFDAPVDGCVLPPDGGPLGYKPSNFDPTALAVADGGVPDAGDAASVVMGGGIDWANAPDVNIAAACDRTCLPAPVVVTMSDGSQADLYAMHSFTVQSSVTLTLRSTANVLTRPVIFAVLTTVDVQGTIDASSNLYSPGAGAYGSPSPSTPTPEGPGGGGDGLNSTYASSAPSGGSFCGVGGRGGFTAAPQALAGGTYGNAQLVPLAAGSGGGVGQVNGYYFGAGGGAVQISAGQSLIVRNVGVIDVGGGGGDYGGGGSGGAILLEAPVVTINGLLTANGGGGGAIGQGSVAGSNGAPDNIAAPGGMSAAQGGMGSAGATINGAAGVEPAPDGGVAYGSGGGGAGFIRINSTCGAATFGANKVISPDLTTSCASQGSL